MTNLIVGVASESYVVDTTSISYQRGSIDSIFGTLFDVLKHLDLRNPSSSESAASEWRINYPGATRSRPRHAVTVYSTPVGKLE